MENRIRDLHQPVGTTHLGGWRNSLDDSGVKDQAGFAARKITRVVTDYPLAALGVAAGLGAVLGWWVKRK